MLKVILNHWQNQRQRPQPTLPVLTTSDEEVVTKVNPIFDEDREESDSSEKPSTSEDTEQPPDSEKEEPKSEEFSTTPVPRVTRLPRVVFSTAGFDSLDSRDDPVGAIVTDVVAEVHRSDTPSLSRILAPNKGEEEERTTVTDSGGADAIRDTDPTEYFNQSRRNSGQPSFLHNSYHHIKQLSVLKRKDKEPRTSIFNFTSSEPVVESPKETNPVLKDNDRKEKDPPKPQVTITEEAVQEVSAKSVSPPPEATDNATVENPYSELSKAGNKEEPSTSKNTISEDILTAAPPPPPPLPSQLTKVDKATYTSSPLTSLVLSEIAAKLGNDVKKPEVLSHAEILKKAMLANNNNLKPSEIAKRERELRTAAARERGDILPKLNTEVKTPFENQPSNPIAPKQQTANATTTPKFAPKQTENAPTSPKIAPKQTANPPTSPKIVPKQTAQTNFKKPPQMTFPKPPPMEDTSMGNDIPPPDEEISVSAAKPSEDTEVKRPFDTVKTQVKAVRTNSITRAENSQAVDSRRDSKPKTPPKNMPCRKCDRLHDPEEPCPSVTERTEIPKPKKGVTRGDQIGTEESSGNTSNSGSSGPGPSKQRSEGDGGREKRPKSPHICPHCFMHGRRSVRMKRPPELSKYDDYYLNAIHGSRSHRFSADSLSDFSTDHYDRHFHPRLVKKHRRKHHDYPERPFSRQSRGGFRSPPEGSTLGTDEFDEEYLDKVPYKKRRRFSWGSCSCDQCSEASSFIFERRPKSFGEADEDKFNSIRSKGKGHPSGCTCGHNAQNGRRVKFEEKSNPTGQKTSEDPKEDGKEGPSKDNPDDPGDISKDKDGEGETNNEKKSSQKEGVLKNGHAKGLINGYPQYPWEIEDWDMYMQKRYVVRKRRRALYMGIIALVIIVIIGMAVGLVMVWLRKTAPSK